MDHTNNEDFNMFKNEIFGILARMAKESDERIKRIEEMQENLIKENQNMINAFSGMMSRLGEKIDAMNDSNDANVSQKDQIAVSDGNPEKLLGAMIRLGAKIDGLNVSDDTDVSQKDLRAVNDGNVERLLQTFDKVMLEAADKLAEYNKTVMTTQSDAVKSYVDTVTDEIVKKHTESMESSYSKSIDDLSGILAGYADAQSEKNADSVRMIQSENNDELQKLAKSLHDLSEENRSYIIDRQHSEKVIDDRINELISAHEAISEKIHYISKETVQAVGRTMDEKIDDLSDKLKEILSKSADRFADSMGEYRDEFLKANADAMRSVHGKLLDKIEETSENVNELYTIVLKLSSEINDKIVEELPDTINDHNKKIKDYIREMRDQIGELSGAIKPLVDGQKESLEYYQKAIEQIEKDSRRMSDLSGKDIKMLEELIKRL